MENQIDKKVENNMDTEVTKRFYGPLDRVIV